MIRGIGSDLVRIERFKRPLTQEHFLERIFTEEERKLLKESGDPVTFAAGRWAAKEAVVKALGTGFVGCEPGEISIERNERGAPGVHLLGTAAQLLMPGERILVTITHEKDYAAAFAVLEGE